MDPESAISGAQARLARARTSWGRFAASRTGRTAIRLARVTFLVAIVTYLAWTLTDVGWSEVVRHLPTNPFFYLLFFASYVLLPVAEVVMYRLSWSFDGVRAFPAFLKKKVYNREVVGYSGEVYFFSWARREVNEPEVRLLETIRDNNILSSISSTAVVVVLLAVFLFAGEVRLEDLVGEGWGWYAGFAGLVVAALVPVALRFRRFLFSMPAGIAYRVFALQCARLLLGQVLQILQWEVVMPDVELGVWFTFAALSILLTRIPFLPNQGLVFMGAGLELSQAVDISTAALAGMLLVTNVLDKGLNFAAFAMVSVLDRRSLTAGERSHPPTGTEAAPSGTATPSGD